MHPTSDPSTLPIAIAIIVSCYFVFSIQLVYQAGGSLYRSKGARAISALVLVFVLCAITGYLSSIVTWLAPWDTQLHWALAAAAIWLVSSNQASAVATLMHNED